MKIRVLFAKMSIQIEEFLDAKALSIFQKYKNIIKCKSKIEII